MDAHFHITTSEQIIGPVCDFTYSWCLNCGLAEADAIRFTVAVSELITDIILFAYPHDSQASFDVEFRHSSRNVELVVSEVGEPFDPDRHRYNPQGALFNDNFEGAGFRLMNAFCDEFVFINKGKEGKEFRLTKQVDGQVRPIDELLEQPALKQVRLDRKAQDRPPRKLEHYTVSQVQPADAEDISKVIYRTYNYTYSKEDMYYPKRIEQAVSGKERLGVIARSDEGEAIGYFAVLKKEDSNIAEVGEAVVSPDFRRQGVMSRMMQQLIDMSRKKRLSALFGKAVTIHFVSQKVNARFGFRTTALMLAETTNVVYKGFDETYPQPVSVVIDFLPINPAGSKAIYPPDRYKEILLGTYNLLGMVVKPKQPAVHNTLAGKSDVHLNIDYARSTAQITVSKYGRDFRSVLTEMVRSLEKRDLNAVYLDLPLENPSTPEQFRHIGPLGFIYCGLAPLFYREADFLRLQKVYVPLDLSLVDVYSEFGKRIKSLVDGEYHRHT